MSDVLAPSDTGQILPGFLTRLRPGRFVSPLGVESAFLFDTLSRSAAKKATAHEIADSDDAVLQDLGAGARSYPMNVYFVGDDHDRLADTFFESLFERYTPDVPGVLKHPRWGDIPVFPFSVDQAESFVDGGVGVSRITVEFWQTKSLSYPVSAALNEGEVTAAAGELQEQVENTTVEIDVSEDTSYSKFRTKMKDAIKKVSDAFTGISDSIAEAQAEIESIKQDLNTALDNLAEPAAILAQFGALVESGAAVVTETPEKLNAYAGVTVDVITTFAAGLGFEVSSKDRKNLAQTLQGVGTLLCSATARAALATDFATRDAVGDAIDSLAAMYATYLAGINTAYAAFDGKIDTQFIPDHDTLSELYGILAATNQLLINRAFDLKTRQTKTLPAPSDPLTLTWELYGDIDKLAFFLATNHIEGDQFTEIPAGNKVVAYV